MPPGSSPEAAVFEPTSLCLACIHLPLSPLYQAVAWRTMGCPVGTRGFQSFGSMESCRTLWEVYSAGHMRCPAWIMLGPIPPECRQHDLKTKILKWTKGWNYWVHIRWTQWGPISLKDWLFLCEKKKKIGGFPGGSDSKASACNVGDPCWIPGSGRSPGEGNGNPLQHSCLENPMDGGAWEATVHGVAKSRTRPSD